MRAYYIAISAWSNLAKLYKATCSEAGVIMWVQLLEGVLPTNFGRAKDVQISTRRHSILSANDTGKDSHNENPSSKWSTTTPPTLGLNIWWSLVHKQKSYRRAGWPTQLNFFREVICRLLGGAVPQIFTTYNPLNCTANWTWGAGRPQVGLCPIFLVYFSFRYQNYTFCEVRCVDECVVLVTWADGARFFGRCQKI